MKPTTVAQKHGEKPVRTVYRIRQCVSFYSLFLALGAIPGNAADGVWTTNASSTWGASTNWLSGVIADGVDATANFSTIDITANRTVTLNSSRSAGSLAINATSGNKFSIELRSLTLGGSAGAVNDWNPTQSYTWRIATASSGMSFLPAEDESTVFQMLLGDFTAYNDLQGGSLSMQRSGNDLNLIFTPVPEPGTWALVLLGFGALAWRHRRMNRNP